MVMHSFSSERSLKTVNFHHNWALLSIIVVIACTWVCGSGVLRITMRVLETRFLEVVFPNFSAAHKIFAYLLASLYVVLIPTCFYILHVQLNAEVSLNSPSDDESFSEGEKNKQ